jgi:hypothetical protein
VTAAGTSHSQRRRRRRAIPAKPARLALLRELATIAKMRSFSLTDFPRTSELLCAADEARLRGLRRFQHDGHTYGIAYGAIRLVVWDVETRRDLVAKWL